MKNSISRKERFALNTWREFDALLRAECPKLPLAWRYELSVMWDNELLRLLEKIDEFKKLGY